LEEHGGLLLCPGGIDCPSQAIQQLKHFVGRDALDLRGLAARRLEALYEAGVVKNPLELVSLNGGNGLGKLKEIPGWGGVSATNLFSEIERARGGLPLWKFVYSLGIRGVGKSTAITLAEEYGDWEVLTLVVLLTLSYLSFSSFVLFYLYCQAILEIDCLLRLQSLWSEMEALGGLKGDGKAIDGASARIRDINNIGDHVEGALRELVKDEKMHAMVHALSQSLHIMPSEATTRGVPTGGVGPMSEEVILFTGKMLQGTREEMEAAAQAMGATIAGGVSRKLTLLVAGAKAGASKLKKAEALGVNVIDEEEWAAFKGNLNPADRVSEARGDDLPNGSRAF